MIVRVKLYGNYKIKCTNDYVLVSYRVVCHVQPCRKQRPTIHPVYISLSLARYRPETQVISQLVMFVEDLNMPLPEQYGAQPPLEFLRQFIGNDGFYDINRYSWKVRAQEKWET